MNYWLSILILDNISNLNTHINILYPILIVSLIKDSLVPEKFDSFIILREAYMNSLRFIRNNEASILIEELLILDELSNYRGQYWISVLWNFSSIRIRFRHVI